MKVAFVLISTEDCSEMKKVILSTLAVFALSGCVTAPFVPPTGMVSSIQAPLDLETTNKQIGSKHGSSSVFTILGMISVGDASYKSAAEDGNITTIKGSDYSYLNVLGLFQKTTVRVYGD